MTYFGLFSKSLWAKKSIENGKMLLCNNLTNTNTPAEGVFLSRMIHEKDEFSLFQVNTYYAVRESDGLPVTFNVFPESVNGISELSETIVNFNKFINECSQDEKEIQIIFISDQKSISEENIILMDNTGVEFLLLLSRNIEITDRMIESHYREVRSSVNYIEDWSQYAATYEETLFDGDTKIRFFHVVWDPILESRHRRHLYSKITDSQKQIQKLIDQITQISEEEVKRFQHWFSIEVKETGSLKACKKKYEKETEIIPVFTIRSFEKKEDAIDHDLHKCGYFILMTSERMTAKDALTTYLKKVCIEKNFMPQGTFLDMDKIGVHADKEINAKSLICFVAAILHSLIFINTNLLRISDCKSYTVPAVIDLLEEITADKNLTTLRYERRYKPNEKQNNILHAIGIPVDEIDNRIENM